MRAPLAGYHDFKLRRVMIAGGSEEGLHLGRLLLDHGVACSVLDSDRRRCVELAEQLPGALVLNADATDLELLEMEGVEGVDGFVVEAIDSLFTFAFEVDEVALKQRLQVMAYHALFLPESFGELVYAERFLSELL